MRNLPVALAQCPSYDSPLLKDTVFGILEKAELPVQSGMNILVKPNLLMCKELACSNASVTAYVCEWLLSMGARVSVADSPGFGTSQKVAKYIGLEEKLTFLGLSIKNFDKKNYLEIELNNKKMNLPIAAMAMESDLIVSVARVKAHSQMRMTLCVKNCFGCIPGMRKAFAHTLYGGETAMFADYIAAIWSKLPPVAGVADGIMAMSVTGPSRGMPFPLQLLGACSDARILDNALLDVLNIPALLVPLSMALSRLGKPADLDTSPSYPLLSPKDFNSEGYKIPHELKSASFNPFRLVKSCVKRLWLSRKK